jgi:hypothetical protein
MAECFAGGIMCALQKILGASVRFGKDPEPAFSRSPTHIRDPLTGPWCEARQALLGHRMPGMTASYSHGGPAWDQKLREAVTILDKVFKMSYGLSYERPAVAVGDPNYLKTGEPAGTRTQDPRLKRAMLYQLSYRLTERRARIVPPTLSPCLERK